MTGLKRIEVVAGILIRQGRVFAAQRAPGGEAGGQWEFPGGKIEAGESHAAALERELMEELGIATRSGPFLIHVEYPYRSFLLAMSCYSASILAGEPQLHEHVDGRWLSRRELDAVTWAPADLPVVERVKCLAELA